MYHTLVIIILPYLPDPQPLLYPPNFMPSLKQSKTKIINKTQFVLLSLSNHCAVSSPKASDILKCGIPC